MSILNYPTSLIETFDNEILITPYPEFNFNEIVQVVPVDSNVESIAHLTLDYNGKTGGVIGVKGENIEKIDFTLDKDSTRVWDMGFSYDIDQSDIRATQGIPNFNLIRDKIVAANFIYRKSLQNLVMRGIDTLKNVKGLSNDPQIPSSPVLGGNALDTSGIDAQTMVKAMTAGLTAVRRQTMNVKSPDTVIMHSKLFDLLADTYYTTGNNASALSKFQESARAILNRDIMIRVIDDFGTGALFYQFGGENARMHMAQELTYFPEQRNGTAYERTAFYRFGGVQIRDKNAFHRVTGLLTDIT